MPKPSDLHRRDAEDAEDRSPGAEVTERIIGAAIEVHRALGPGLLESVYEVCLERELHSLGFEVERQKALPISYKGLVLDASFRLDLIVQNQVLVELKAVQTLEPIHEAQVLTYLRLSGLSVALLINFNVARLTQGVKRIVLSPNPERR
jgi:GxxExxY protein